MSVLVMSAGPLAAMELQVLEPPPDASSFGRILAISADGSRMAGEVIMLAGLQREAVTWNASGGMRLAAISVDDPAVERATGISGDGTVVAGWSLSSRSAGFALLADGSELALTNNQEYRINALSPGGGIAVGTDAAAVNSLDFNAATWNLGSGARTAISDLSGGDANAAFLAISADGQTCFGYGEDSSGRLAVRSDSGGALVAIGDLPGGQVFAEARGVSGDGDVVVGRSRSADGMEAFRWTSGGMAGLGDLPGGAFVSEACSVSDDGLVIVGVAESEMGSEVFVWMEGRGMRSLRTVAKAGGIDLDGWHFGDAWPVLSGDGEVLALNAVDPGQAPRFLRLTGLRATAAGTNPLPETVCGFVGDDFRICFAAEPGLRYQLQCSTTLATGDWVALGEPVTGDGGEVEIVVSGESGPCFFRLMVMD